MAESKGKAGAAEAPATPKTPKGPSVHQPVSWAAIGAQLGGYIDLWGIRFNWPMVDALANSITPGANVVIVPLPTKLVEDAAVTFPRVKKVEGKLPDVVLWPGNDRRNDDIWAAYINEEDHQPYAERLDTARDWAKRLRVPKR